VANNISFPGAVRFFSSAYLKDPNPPVLLCEMVVVIMAVLMQPMAIEKPDQL